MKGDATESVQTNSDTSPNLWKWDMDID